MADYERVQGEHNALYIDIEEVDDQAFTITSATLTIESGAGVKLIDAAAATVSSARLSRSVDIDPEVFAPGCYSLFWAFISGGEEYVVKKTLLVERGA